MILFKLGDMLKKNFLYTLLHASAKPESMVPHGKCDTFAPLLSRYSTTWRCPASIAFVVGVVRSPAVIQGTLIIAKQDRWIAILSEASALMIDTLWHGSIFIIFTSSLRDAFRLKSTFKNKIEDNTIIQEKTWK